MFCKLERIHSVLTVLFLLSGAAGVASAQSAKPLGMILSVQGTVNIQRGRGNEKAQPADLLFPSDQITTAANSKVTFSFCPASQKYSLNADSAVSVAAATIQQTKGAPASKAAAARCTLPQIALGKYEIDHIGVMKARGAPEIPLYVGGPISTARPLFMWEPKATAEEYKLIVKKGAQTVWTWNQKGQPSEVRMPQTVPELQPGAYVWELTALAGTTIVGQQTAMFEVKPNSDLSSMRGEGISPLEMAVTFENAGYYSEAAAIYRTLRSQNGNDLRFTRNLLWLYWETGLFAASNAELKRIEAQK